MSSLLIGEAVPGDGTVALAAASPAVVRSVLELNRAHEIELSPLDAGALRSLVENSFLARVTSDGAAFLIALDQDADYESANFAWFRERFTRFVYVDRLAVARSARGRGLARLLYAELFAAASDARHAIVACEVNVVPLNEASDALHASLGFAEVGRATLVSGKTVRYLTRGI